MATISASPAVTTYRTGSAVSGELLRGAIPASAAQGQWFPKTGVPTLPTGEQASAWLQDRAVRLLLLAVAVFLTTLAISATVGQSTTATSAAGTTAPLGPVETTAYPAYTVMAGDTLWGIAQQVSPEVDPRAVVLQLRLLNNLTSQDVLRAGDVLLLPASQ